MIIAVSGCSGHKNYHETDMPDPKGFNAHFGDMDENGDEAVTWEEFAAYFPEAKKDIFKSLDLNEDGVVDHDEWHEFKDAHGLRDH
jgi:hypothetical protein